MEIPVVQKYDFNVNNIEQVLLVAREEALKQMAKRLPHLSEEEAIKQIIACAESDPEGDVVKHFQSYIGLALKSFF